jgi:hypothetical protein
LKDCEVVDESVAVLIKTMPLPEGAADHVKSMSVLVALDST